MQNNSNFSFSGFFELILLLVVVVLVVVLRVSVHYFCEYLCLNFPGKELPLVSLDLLLLSNTTLYTEIPCECVPSTLINAGLIGAYGR